MDCSVVNIRRNAMRHLTTLLIAGILGASITLAAADKSLNLKKLESMLINSKGRKAKNINLKDKTYILIYFSAHWCPPCRRFTPKLVKFYNKFSKKGNFEVIFVSADSTRKAQLGYMTSDSMPWPAVKFSKIRQSGLQSYAGRGIPCLVMIKPDGSVVSDTNVNGQYMGPQKVLADLKKILSEKKD